MRGRSDRPRLIDRAARGAAGGMTRRDLVRLAAGAAGVAAVSSLPGAAWPTVARAQTTTGLCPAQRRGTCPTGLRAMPWTPGARVAVPSGVASTFNGCGAEGGLKIPFVGDMDPVPDTPSLADFFYGCKEHDCCYGRCGADKRACDDAFLADSLRACSEAHDDDGPIGWAMQLNCNQVAAFYRFGVSGSIGQQAYEAAQAEACIACERCDRPCGEQCCPPDEVCRDGACREPLRCPSGTSECDGYCCKDGLCVDGRCARLCDGSPCPLDQDCCFRGGGDPNARGVCCARGTYCSYNIGGVGRCLVG